MPCAQTLKDIAHTKCTSDFLDIDRFALEGKTRIASDHEQPFNRESAVMISSTIPSAKTLLGIAAHVLERQYGDRGFVRGHECGL